jgi:hypothetical protein
MSVEVAKQLSERYGPYAFGLVSLLVVWFAIVDPTLRNNRVDVEALRQVATQQAETAVLFKEAAVKQSETAILMARTAERLDTIAARLERINAQDK